MGEAQELMPVLMADDDPDDRMLTKMAWKGAKIGNELLFVTDGERLMSYLRKEGEFADAKRPGLILLDLNMPRMDGREALKLIKSDPELKRIPVVVLTTSKAEEDVLRTYDLGVNSFIVKPVTYEGLVDAVSTLNAFWLQLASTP